MSNYQRVNQVKLQSQCSASLNGVRTVRTVRTGLACCRWTGYPEGWESTTKQVSWLFTTLSFWDPQQIVVIWCNICTNHLSWPKFRPRPIAVKTKQMLGPAGHSCECTCLQATFLDPKLYLPDSSDADSNCCCGHRIFLLTFPIKGDSNPPEGSICEFEIANGTWDDHLPMFRTAG